MRELAAAFTRLTATERASFLAHVCHMATIAAREAYEKDWAGPNGIIALRDANELVHRVSGYIEPVLGGAGLDGQAASVFAMIWQYFQAHQLERHLYEWLRMAAIEGAAGREFAATNLVKVTVDVSGWTILHRDKRTGEFWIESYPNSHLHGGGTPVFIKISDEEAERNFPIGR
jgi:Immunity protein 27